MCYSEIFMNLPTNTAIYFVRTEDKHERQDADCRCAFAKVLSSNRLCLLAQWLMTVDINANYYLYKLIVLNDKYNNLN